MNECSNCKKNIKEINSIKIDNIKLKENISNLEKIILSLKKELEEIKINNYDSIDEYFT